MPTANHGGALVYVRGTSCSVSSAVSIPPCKLATALDALGDTKSGALDCGATTTLSTATPPPAYSCIYPPSPPASQPNSPDSLPVRKPYAPSIASSRSSSSLAAKPNHVTVATPAKPLLTPRSSTDDAPTMTTRSNVLAKVFPASSGVHQLPKTHVDLHQTVPGWKGSVLENPAMGTRTLFVSGGSYEDVNLRESVCGVLDLAEEELGATGIVMCLEKNSPDLGELIHQLLYVGGTITTGPFAPNPAYILVGLDL